MATKIVADFHESSSIFALPRALAMPKNPTVNGSQLEVFVPCIAEIVIDCAMDYSREVPVAA